MRALFVLCLLIANRAEARPVGRALERTPVSILGDHVALQLPIGMELAPALWTPDARAELEVDGGRFVMIAYETYQHVGTDLRAGVLAELRREGGGLAHARVTAIPDLDDQIDAVTVHPPLPAATADQNLVLAVYIASSDATVQVIAFYVVGSARDATAEWTELAERVAQTIRPGKSDLQTYAGLLHLGQRHMRIACHDDCAIRISDAGYQVRPIVGLGHTQLCTLDDGPAPRRRATRRSAQILGRDVIWNEWSDADGVHAATSVALDDVEEIRIACDATSREELDAVRAVVEAMTFGN